MAIDSEITRNVEQVRNATYGKDVREAIARGLELCYGYTSGETADEAAQRANAAAEAVEGLIDESREAVREVQAALEDIDDIIKVQPDQPTEAGNKIWVQPQDDTEYKVASFAAYEELWSRMNDFEAEYGDGHGGIKSIEFDSEYDDPEDPRKRRYIITYSDDTQTEFFVNDGEEGPQGDVDQIIDVIIHYKLQSPQEYNGQRPEDYTTEIPSTLPSGYYLWTIAENVYASEARSYNYSVTRIGIDGSGAVNSVAIGNTTGAVGDVKLPVDQAPSAGSGSLLTSGTVYSALQLKADLASPAFTGNPTAPTQTSGDSSTKIATTAFVQTAVASVNAASAIKIDLEMNAGSISQTYTKPIITSNTVVLGFTDFSSDAFSSPLNWETTDEHTLIITTDTAPSTAVTFKAILVEASYVN